MGKITINELHNSLFDYVQTVSDDKLETNNKTIVGAINELFSDNSNDIEINNLKNEISNGKKLIADAIGEPLNAEDTFTEMSTDINSLLSQFKTNMMNNGVTVESGDKFKSLIDKIANSGLNIISATELPSEVVNNQIVLITTNTPTDINVKDSSLCNPTTNGEVNIGIVTVPDDSGVPYNITQNNIMMSLYLKVAKERVNNVVSTLNGYAGIGGQWVQFSKATFLVYDNGQDNYGISTPSNWSLAYASFTPGTSNFAIYINGHGDNAWQDAAGWFNKKFDLTNYSTLKITGTKHSSATFGFSTSVGTTASISKSFSLGTSSSEITVDISSLKGEYYLLVKGRSATSKYVAASISRFELIPEEKNMPIINNNGLDIISATELPSEVVNNQIVLISNIDPTAIEIKDNSLCNPSVEGMVNVGTTSTNNGKYCTIAKDNITVLLYLIRALQYVNGSVKQLSAYVGIDGSWVQFSWAGLYAFISGAYENSDLFGTFTSAPTSSTIYGAYPPEISGNNVMIGQTSSSSSYDESGYYKGNALYYFTTKINCTNYSKLKITVSNYSKTNVSTGYIHFGIKQANNTYFNSSTDKYIEITKTGTYEVDLSSYNSTGYIAAYIFSNSYSSTKNCSAYVYISSIELMP